jgi:RNA polymerase sigma-70 factor, ECF subfamily
LAIDAKLVERLHRQARAGRWRVTVERFGEVLLASADRSASAPDALERYLRGLHLEDLALACACADGDEDAWDYFVLEHRPALYRAADALDSSGGARELADSLYAELFGLRETGTGRQSLFRYFHGRSSLTTWLRAVLAQRYVDRIRQTRRLEALPDDDSPKAIPATPRAADPRRQSYIELMERSLKKAVSSLEARDRLRLACYYAQGLKLAAIGRLLGEHEATCSRQLARTRILIRTDVEQQLRTEHGLSEAEIGQCFASVTDDAGPLDLQRIFNKGTERKESALDRSN